MIEFVDFTEAIGILQVRSLRIKIMLLLNDMESVIPLELNELNEMI